MDSTTKKKMETLLMDNMLLEKLFQVQYECKKWQGNQSEPMYIYTYFANNETLWIIENVIN